MTEEGDRADSIAGLDWKGAVRIAKLRLCSGEDPNAILADAHKAMQIVGQRFSEDTC